MSELKSQMSQTSNANDTDTVSWLEIVVVHGSKHSSSGTHEWASVLWLNAFRNFVAESCVENGMASETTQADWEYGTLETHNLAASRALLAVEAGTLQVSKAKRDWGEWR
jgi:hypothetical protein